MVYNRHIHHRPIAPAQGRRSIRIPGYDYTQPGWYFVTICTQNRTEMFGVVENGEMVLNEYGRIVNKIWMDIPKHFANVDLDEFIIMPNHVHGIIVIMNDATVGAKHFYAVYHSKQDSVDSNASPLQNPRPNGTKPNSLSSIIQNYKSITTRKINQIQKTPGQKLWQRNYYEHIIRDDNDLNRIREYIKNNPGQWQDDRYNQT